MRWLIVVVFLAGCGLVPTAENRAADAAREKARRVGNVLHSLQGRKAEDVGRRAAELDEVDVLKVSGTSPVRVVVRVEGSASTSSGQDVTVRRCFELRIGVRTEWDATPKDVECPANPPLTYAPRPKAPEIPNERLEKALPRVPQGGTVNEAKVRAAVKGLRVDPAVHTEFAIRNGVVGLRLWARSGTEGPMDCVLARVAPGETRVWTPTRIQRMPGEGGCDIGNAFAS